MHNVLPKKLKAPRSSKLENVTLRGLGGGWNAVDDDLSMQPRFAKVVRNFRRTTSGSQKLRYGSKWVADFADTVDGDVMDMEYFNGKLVVVTDEGEIASVSEGGTVTAIWNATIASALPGSPTGWTNTYFSVDFVPFKSELIIHNGVDKPVTIDSSFAVTYLQDLASGSNINVPIGKYGCTASNYHCIAGIPASKTQVHISNAGTAGTFSGDPDPNDGISIDVGAYAPEGAAEIRGIAGFRNYLIVFFSGQSLVITLGAYDDAGNHKPEFPDTLPQFGLSGHRNIVTLENDLVFGSLTGIHSAKRNLFSGQINSETLSALIDPEYVGDMDDFTESEQLYKTFAVRDKLSSDLLFFVPSGRVFVYSSNPQLRYKAWSEYEYGETDWTCGCASQLGRVFLGEGTRIFQLGNKAMSDETYQADRIGDRDTTWDAETAFTIGDLVLDSDTGDIYTCAVSHTKPISGTFAEARAGFPDYWELYLGNEIEFVLEFPWLDGRDPMKVKKNVFAQLGTRGSATFTLEAYVDDLFQDADGNVLYDPALELEFIGNQARGFGYDEGPFGGGRRSASTRLYKFPVRFKSMKPRIVGSARHPLEIVNMSFLFSKGRYKR